MIEEKIVKKNNMNYEDEKANLIFNTIVKILTISLIISATIIIITA